MDILAETNNGERVNIEIQFNNKYDMVKRSIYYWSHVYTSPFNKRGAYASLRPAIAINIMNFNLFNQTKHFHTIFHLSEDEKKFKLTDVMEFHFIEMPKLIKAWQAGELDPWNDVLARRLLMLGMVDQSRSKVYDDIFKELEGIAMKDEVLHEAFENRKGLSGSEEEYFAYLSRFKQIMDEEAMALEAEMRLKEGIKIARKEEKENTARKLFNMGMDIEVIMEATGLSEENIKKIIQ